MNPLSFSPLDSLFQEHNFFISYQLISMMKDDEDSTSASAMVNVFVQPSDTQFSKIISKIIDDEVSRCGGQEILVFRDSMSPAAKFLDVLLEEYASKRMYKVLSKLKSKLQKVAATLEVNPAKISDQDTLKRNQAAVTQLAFDVLTLIFASTKKFPIVIAHIISLLAEKLSQFTSNEAATRTAVGTIVMLKLIGPLLCSNTGLITTITSPRKKGIDTLALTKGLITVAKILQAIANGVLYEEENYMSCFNEFITQSTLIYEQFQENIMKLSAKSKQIVPDLGPKRLVKDWNRVYQYMQRNKTRIVAKCEALDDIATISTSIDCSLPISGVELVAQLEQAMKLVAAEKERAELDNLQVFM